MKPCQKTHIRALEKIVGRLDLIEESPANMVWIMKEGIWEYCGKRKQRKFPDLILGYNEKTIPIELKSIETNHRERAIEQIASGRDFILGVLNKNCPYGRIAYYSPRMNISSEKILFE